MRCRRGYACRYVCLAFCLSVSKGMFTSLILSDFISPDWTGQGPLFSLVQMQISHMRWDEWFERSLTPKRMELVSGTCLTTNDRLCIRGPDPLGRKVKPLVESVYGLFYCRFYTQRRDFPVSLSAAKRNIPPWSWSFIYDVDLDLDLDVFKTNHRAKRT